MAFASCSSVSGAGVILAAEKTFTAAVPHGTWGAQMAIFLVLSAKSFNPLIPPGFLGHGDLEDVRDEGCRGLGRAHIGDRFHRGGIGGGKDVDRRPSSIWAASVALEPKLKITWCPASWPRTPCRSG